MYLFKTGPILSYLYRFVNAFFDFFAKNFSTNGSQTYLKPNPWEPLAMGTFPTLNPLPLRCGKKATWVKVGDRLSGIACIGIALRQAAKGGGQGRRFSLI